MQRSEVGRRGEDLAARYLEARGWRILERNYRRREGEIDIVARRGGLLAFVEVKSRRSCAYGVPAEAVTYPKRARIRTLARLFLAERRPGADTVRFDVVEVRWAEGQARINHLEGAF